MTVSSHDPDAVSADPFMHPEFVWVARGGWRGCFVKGSALHEWFADGARPDEIPVARDAVVRDGSRSRCARIDSLGEASPLQQPMFFKVYRRRRGAQAWVKRAIGWHLPTWVWRMSWRLVEAGVPVARPFGYLVPQVFAWGKTSYYWSQWIEGGTAAKALARSAATRAVVSEDVRFAERSAEILARIHSAGVYHRDMNWGNLIVEGTVDRVWLVDLDSAHRWTDDPKGAAYRDLARFLMDAVEYDAPQFWRDRFLDVYAESRGMSADALSSNVQATMQDFYERRIVKRRKRRHRHVQMHAREK